ncbi:MAG TPA: efflux RND transporter periplasmic adaptor subunit [Gemmatimonadaceae bacterium]|nr:efflux RND transporter periplasmic adaptor subunit [Gemmatimonadaceae bacterium]
MKTLAIFTLSAVLLACGSTPQGTATANGGASTSTGGGGKRGGRGGAGANMPVPVAVTSVRRAAVPYNIGANGTVYPIQTAAVASQVDGIVRKVAFREGDEVQAGQLLFEIDPIPYRAAYNQAVANLARDRATLVNANAEVVRYDDLVQKDYVTKEQADQIRANAGVAQATVVSDSAAVANAKFNLDNSAVRAPITGRTGQLLVREGNLVHGAAATPLVVINQIKPIYVQFAVPATNLPDIQKYIATGSLPVTVAPTSSALPPSANDQQTDAPPGTSISSGDPAPTASQPSAPSPQPQQQASGPPSHPAVTSQPRSSGGASGAPTSGPVTVNVPQTTGTLSFVNNAVDTVTGTVLLKGTFGNQRGELWPGEYVATTLRLYVQQDALVVPQQAVMTGQQGSYVFVIDKANTAQQRSIVVSRVADTLVVISKGLAEGERVVTDGQSRLTQGAKVNVRGLQTAASSGSLP